jgi:hypothetical protein
MRAQSRRPIQFSSSAASTSFTTPFLAGGTHAARRWQNDLAPLEIRAAVAASKLANLRVDEIDTAHILDVRPATGVLYQRGIDFQGLAGPFDKPDGLALL